MKNSIFLLILLFYGCASTTIKKSTNDWVDPFVGTGAHGHTYPGASVPFGAIQLSSDTRIGNWDACSGYHYTDNTLLGFSHTHLSGTGCIDLGDVLFRPTTQKRGLSNFNKKLYEPTPFKHKNEWASPGYYSVVLPEEKIKVELTTTTYAGVHKYTYPSKDEGYLVIDLSHLLDNEVIYQSKLSQKSDYEIVGMRSTKGWVDHQYVYFVAQFSKPIKDIEFFDGKQLIPNVKSIEGKNLQSRLSFNLDNDSTLEIKVGLSLVSVENARENLKAEVKQKNDFESIKKRAETTWNKQLSLIEVETGNENLKKNFYTALYHTMLAPNVVSDMNGEYRKHSMEIGKLEQNKKQYSTFSLWDTFRTWNPLMTLIDTTLVNNMINSYLNIYDATGELPIWPLSAGETETMIGYHSVSVIADAYLKGIRGFDAKKALRAMEKSAEKNKKGAEFYIKYGFIPSNIKKESVSCLLEFAYDDWCIAQMAKEMGELQIYEKFIQRSQNYVNVFNGNTKFFQGKKMDGNWIQPFDSFEVGRDYTEATAWQYRFFVPHDIEGMVQLFGEKDSFVASLDSIFTTTSKINGDLADISGLIGQYAHGNEPSHHIAYLYNYIGMPWKTQQMTRKILETMYQPTPEGISGNEDCGQMSAWYIMSSLGLYPVCPGSTEFVLTSPLFEKSTLKLANGKSLVIKANHPSKNSYIDKVTFNGSVIEDNFINYKELMEGGILEFTLSPQPNYTRGVLPTNAPYSYTKEKVVSIPYVKENLHLFDDKIMVTLSTTTENAQIYYTLDGSEPTQKSRLYTKPFVLNTDTTIKAKGFKKDFNPSKTLSIEATKAVYMPSKTISNPTQGLIYEYYKGNFSSVSEIMKSSIVKSGITDDISIEDADKEDHFAYIFKGYIKVEQEGKYDFRLTSDDGSRLYIDNVSVVDNDGSHAAISASGTVALKKGYHSYILLYFEDYEGQFLKWEWKPPYSEKFIPISSQELYLNKH